MTAQPRTSSEPARARTPAAAAGSVGRLTLASERRRHRLFGTKEFLTLLCADVGLQVGPPGGTSRWTDLLRYIELPWDGVALTQAAVDRFAPVLAQQTGKRLVVRLDWCSQWRSLSPMAEGVGATVSSPGAAARSGADAVMHYALLGHSDPRVEADYVARAAAVVEQAHDVGLPCILEPLVRGAKVLGNERDPDHQVWAMRTAQELGADAVKIEAPLDVDSVLAASDIPVLIASTPPIGDVEAVERARRAKTAGAAGVAYAADVFASASPHRLVHELSMVAGPGSG